MIMKTAVEYARLTAAKTFFCVLLALSFCGAAHAQFDAAKVAPQPLAIARYFPDPPVVYATPAFAPGRQDFTLHAQEGAFLEALAKRSPRVALQTVGSSQQGRVIRLAVLTGAQGSNAQLPTVLLMALQHGNEPAGGEAALALALSLATDRQDLLDRVNVLILPRANPDAAERFGRESANGIDINRDHLLLRTPEAQAIAAVVRRYNPQVVADLHEFTVGGRWVSKFGAVMRDDALLQAATVGNLSAGVGAAQTRYLQAARNALAAAGHRVNDYHTTSADAKDLTVSMGGVNADTGRNVAGLRHAVSVLIETRGVGIGRAHFARRVHSHVLIAMALIETAAADGPALVNLQRQAGSAATAQACTGNMAITVHATPQQRTLIFLDATSGELREVQVDWRSSLALKLESERPRPCGYLLGASQTMAVQHLRDLGVQVERVGQAPGLWQVQAYVVQADTAGQRQDARGTIADQQGSIRVLTVSTQDQTLVPDEGGYYVSMKQPLAPLVSAALEPDTQNSFVANGLLASGGGQLLRVIQGPPVGSLGKALP